MSVDAIVEFLFDAAAVPPVLEDPAADFSVAAEVAAARMEDRTPVGAAIFEPVLELERDFFLGAGDFTFETAEEAIFFGGADFRITFLAITCFGAAFLGAGLEAARVGSLDVGLLARAIGFLGATALFFAGFDAALFDETTFFEGLDAPFFGDIATFLVDFAIGVTMVRNTDPRLKNRTFCEKVLISKRMSQNTLTCERILKLVSRSRKTILHRSSLIFSPHSAPLTPQSPFFFAF